jgi:hypothetical protein
MGMVISPKKQVPSTVAFRSNSEQTAQHLFRSKMLGCRFTLKILP